MTDSSGKVVMDQDYLPFGGDLARANQIEVRNDTDESYKYTGQKQVISIGLYYYGARYYDPEIGRFITEDSYRGDISRPQTLNLYVYVLNNPLRYTDPTGHSEEDIEHDNLKDEIHSQDIENKDELKIESELMNDNLNLEQESNSILANGKSQFYGGIGQIKTALDEKHLPMTVRVYIGGHGFGNSFEGLLKMGGASDEFAEKANLLKNAYKNRYKTGMIGIGIIAGLKQNPLEFSFSKFKSRVKQASDIGEHMGRDVYATMDLAVTGYTFLSGLNDFRDPNIHGVIELKKNMGTWSKLWNITQVGNDGYGILGYFKGEGMKYREEIKSLFSEDE